MNANTFGSRLTITTFGESHSPAVGVVIDGVPPGLSVTQAQIADLLKRRRPGEHSHASARREADEPEILSGIFEGKTLGTPIAVIIRNDDARPWDYGALVDLFRPGHGDFTWEKKFGIRDHRGGGRASGRETAARVAAGAVAMELLKARQISVTGYTVAVGPVRAEKIEMALLEQTPFRFADPAMVPAVEAYLEQVASQKESAGAVVELIVQGLPPGVGDPVFDKLDARLAGALMSVGAVKGVEIGDGFRAATVMGSQNNDAMTPEGFCSNHAGGILGGISTGQPVVMRVAVKPVPTIGVPQQTVDRHGKPHIFEGTGRHDRVLVPRIIPVLEAMVALTVADALETQEALRESRSLAQIRDAIDEIDGQLLTLLARRFSLALAAGQEKLKLGVVVEDGGRDAEVSHKWQITGLSHGLDDTFIHALRELVVAKSKALQEQKRKDNV
ncbi:chorismate synthase [Myxococcota bacterium]|nr:chorismate synthase [Myxococcota bacterium]MBU1535129.1 chorismate synthase [Myxococcota bacterium]